MQDELQQQRSQRRVDEAEGVNEPQRRAVRTVNRRDANAHDSIVDDSEWESDCSDPARGQHAAVAAAATLGAMATPRSHRPGNRGVLRHGGDHERSNSPVSTPSRLRRASGRAGGAVLAAPPAGSVDSAAAVVTASAGVASMALSPASEASLAMAWSPQAGTAGVTASAPSQFPQNAGVAAAMAYSPHAAAGFGPMAFAPQGGGGSAPPMTWMTMAPSGSMPGGMTMMMPMSMMMPMPMHMAAPSPMHMHMGGVHGVPMPAATPAAVGMPSAHGPHGPPSAASDASGPQYGGHGSASRGVADGGFGDGVSMAYGVPATTQTQVDDGLRVGVEVAGDASACMLHCASSSKPRCVSLLSRAIAPRS